MDRLSGLWPEDATPSGDLGDLFDEPTGPVADKYGLVREVSPGVLIVTYLPPVGLDGVRFLQCCDPGEWGRLKRLLRPRETSGRPAIFVLGNTGVDERTLLRRLGTTVADALHRCGSHKLAARSQ